MVKLLVAESLRIRGLPVDSIGGELASQSTDCICVSDGESDASALNNLSAAE
jgi:hypothetical protein